MAANEVTKTQELLAILQTRPWTKAERASARQQISRYYQRKLASLQHALFEAIAPAHGEKPDPFERDTSIHRYHKQSQELSTFHARSMPNEALALWLRIIDEDDRGLAVWQPRTQLFQEENLHHYGQKEPTSEAPAGKAASAVSLLSQSVPGYALDKLSSV